MDMFVLKQRGCESEKKDRCDDGRSYIFFVLRQRCYLRCEAAQRGVLGLGGAVEPGHDYGGNHLSKTPRSRPHRLGTNASPPCANRLMALHPFTGSAASFIAFARNAVSLSFGAGLNAHRSQLAFQIPVSRLRLWLRSQAECPWRS